ncbi:hypothetical protein DY000_02039018 [Brassica cretica]|uniref:Ubiquitin-like protease family profile domain-containing protein n=1 Tax=Brassica cretica TaxID=69181 RepID=A0ABQ7B9X1_BRACR|nr:hypothetical protein DY000_02039018 [Brassica cretica]
MRSRGRRKATTWFLGGGRCKCVPKSRWRCRRKIRGLESRRGKIAHPTEVVGNQRLFGGGRRDITIAEVAAMVAGDKEMPPVRKLKLWLGLVDVLDAEHDPKLTVQPMYKPGKDKEDGWGEFDSEIFDRKVAYMVGLVKTGHKFSIGEWVGGDADEPMYDHEEATKDKKRKQYRGPSREQEGHTLKQRRLSRFFSKKVAGGGHDVAELHAKVKKLSQAFANSDSSSDEDGTDRINESAPGQDGIGLEGMEPELVTDPSGKMDVVPLEAENTRGVDKRNDDVGSLRGDEGDGVASGTELVCEDHASGEEHESMEETAAKVKGDVGETEVEKDEAVEKEADVKGRHEEKEDDVTAADGVKGGSEDESDEEKMLAREETMVELSDSSPCPRSEKHKPVEREADLAALLLAKEQFTMDKLVPEVEDPDYAFFESVLVANPKVLHLNAGNYNLDNLFFRDLAALRKWVSTEHMEALVDYVGQRHDERLKQRRCLFLKPWFVAHLQGKARSFNAAKFNKGRVVGDGRLSSFLKKEGKKWGEDVDTLYTPMIWDGNHWVGLCISLTNWRVLVLDPNPKLKDMAAVCGLLDSVAQMFPYLVEKVIQMDTRVIGTCVHVVDIQVDMRSCWGVDPA